MKAFERNKLEARHLHPTEASSNYMLDFFFAKELRSNFGFSKVFTFDGFYSPFQYILRVYRTI